MCDTYISDGDVGYVCTDCKQEFKDYMKNITNKFDSSFGEILGELKKFMETPAGTYAAGEPMDVDRFFENFEDHEN